MVIFLKVLGIITVFVLSVIGLLCVVGGLITSGEYNFPDNYDDEPDDEDPNDSSTLS